MALSGRSRFARAARSPLQWRAALVVLVPTTGVGCAAHTGDGAGTADGLGAGATPPGSHGVSEVCYEGAVVDVAAPRGCWCSDWRLYCGVGATAGDALDAPAPLLQRPSSAGGDVDSSNGSTVLLPMIATGAEAAAVAAQSARVTLMPPAPGR